MPMLEIGSLAPDFNLPADDGGNVSLKTLVGKKVVLYFYPKADTSGCTIEAQDFTALSPQFAAANTIVLGVSADEVKKLCKFRDKYALSVKLLSDVDTSTLNAYGVWVEKSMYGKKYMGIERATFLIDETGKIVKIWPKVKIDGHAAEVLATVIA